MRRAAAAAAGLALVLAAAGCGGDDEPEPTAGGGRETAAHTAEEPSRDMGPATAEKAPQPTETASPEKQPGGAGDEEPARSQAQFTGRAGHVSPSVVRVPPYIAVQVALRSADGGAYYLVIGGRKVGAGKSITLDGLRPGAAYSGRAGGGGDVRIEASAEPGP